MDKSNNHPIVEWDDLTIEDKQRAEQLLKELNQIMDRYITEEQPSAKIPFTEE